MTLPNSKQIIIVDVETLDVVKRIDTEKEYHAIALIDNEFVVGGHACLDVMSSNGDACRSFSVSNTGIVRCLIGDSARNFIIY